MKNKNTIQTPEQAFDIINYMMINRQTQEEEVFNENMKTLFKAFAVKEFWQNMGDIQRTTLKTGLEDLVRAEDKSPHKTSTAYALLNVYRGGLGSSMQMVGNIITATPLKNNL